MHKLPAFQTIKHALKAVFQFRNAGIRIGLPWVLVLAVISVIECIFFTVLPRNRRMARRKHDIARPYGVYHRGFQPGDFFLHRRELAPLYPA